MRSLPKGTDTADLPDMAHFRGHGIDRSTVCCHSPLCGHQHGLTFDDLAIYGVNDVTKLWELAPRYTKCRLRNADVQPHWSQSRELFQTPGATLNQSLGCRPLRLAL